MTVLVVLAAYTPLAIVAVFVYRESSKSRRSRGVSVPLNPTKKVEK